MSGWRPLAEQLPSVGPDRGRSELDLSERTIEDLWQIAAEHLPQDPERQALVVTMAVRLQLGPAALAARCRRIRRERDGLAVDR